MRILFQRLSALGLHFLLVTALFLLKKAGEKWQQLCPSSICSCQCCFRSQIRRDIDYCLARSSVSNPFALTEQGIRACSKSWTQQSERHHKTTKESGVYLQSIHGSIRRLIYLYLLYAIHIILLDKTKKFTLW